ncbi:hypothetical protein RJ55_01015 [Drechmeria coniospora]|nr:hypothetical protein RJ55_01015 [Drechmeria coniospora]
MADNDPQDKQTLVTNFCSASGAGEETARSLALQYLEAHNWDYISACNSFFADEDDENEADQNQPYTGPRTLGGLPAPQPEGRPAASTSSHKKRGVATLGSLGASSRARDDGDDDDGNEEDESRGNLFAGGEKSGLAVQDPRREGSGPRSIINDILAKAKANTTRPDETAEAGPSSASRFRGTGVTLGGDGTESRSIPDPLGPARAAAGGPQERVLHIWQDGFSVDDGELRRFDDPANQADLAMIRSGRAPLHLMGVEHDQPVDVKLHQHDTPYTAQPKKYKPFGGSGQRLGSPVPGAGSGQTAASTLAASSSTAPAAASAPAVAAPVVDSTQPTTMIRIQMPDGTRLPARFNTTHTVGDVYDFVQGASAETRNRSWMLVTTFPNKEHADKRLVLGSVPEFKKGGTAMVKWV